MLAHLTIELSAQDLNHSMGSLFHGFLMDFIDPAYAEYFHYNSTNPFSACLFRDARSKNFCWRISTFNQKAYDMILVPLLSNMPKIIYLSHKDREIGVVSHQLQSTSFENLFMQPAAEQRIRLLTPTSFKSDGRTHIFPDIATLMQGVINKINRHSDSIKLEDNTAVERLLQALYIRNYYLKTAVYDIQGLKIKGFMGSLDLGLQRAKELESLLHFLIAASEYTGFGIKTALGMGGIQIEHSNR